MKQLIREYFTFNKRERNGILVLLTIIVLLIIYLSVSGQFTQTEHIDFTKFEKEILALSNVEDVIHFTKQKKNDKKDTLQTAQRFSFNPNNLPESEWKKLGLSEKQIHSIKKYESKGGVFRCKEDVKKMVVISSALYTSLEPYISIPNEKEKSVTREKKNTTPPIAILELNTADSTQLTSIKGVGPYFAKGIIKYRTILGGYHSKEQLLEVWKLDKEKYEMIQAFIRVDSSRIQKKNINTSTAQELKHPYINWKVANAIVNYRMKHGNYATVGEVKKTGLIDQEAFLRMAPYLKAGN